MKINKQVGFPGNKIKVASLVQYKSQIGEQLIIPNLIIYDLLRERAR